MISNAVVTYQAKPESIEEHIGLIDQVFAQLHREAPPNVEYKVLRLDDGVSFVHVSTADTPDGSNPLTALDAFKAFTESITDRLTTPPSASGAQIIGTYAPSGALAD
jgi:hypothetical protein